MLRIALIAALVLARGSLAAEDLENWFNDPFFQVTRAIQPCPLPAGPFVDERGRREQTHRRAEKGTTCWLAGECERPNAHAYDEEIAAAIRQAFAASTAFSQTTLWVTVQGRVVYIEGCASEQATAARAESLVRSVRHVQQAIALVRAGATSTVPYKVRREP